MATDFLPISSVAWLSSCCAGVCVVPAWQMGFCADGAVWAGGMLAFPWLGLGLVELPLELLTAWGSGEHLAISVSFQNNKQIYYSCSIAQFKQSPSTQSFPLLSQLDAGMELCCLENDRVSGILLNMSAREWDKTIQGCFSPSGYRQCSYFSRAQPEQGYPCWWPQSEECIEAGAWLMKSYFSPSHNTILLGNHWSFLLTVIESQHLVLL